MSLVPIQEYSDAAKMLADARARRARFYSPTPACPDPVVIEKAEQARGILLADRAAARVDAGSAKLNASRRFRRLLMAYRGKWPSYREIAIAQGNLSSPVLAKAIIANVARQRGISPSDIISQSRKVELVDARGLAVWICAQETPLSLPQIGAIFNRDHTSIMNLIRRENARRGKNVRGLGSKSKGRVQ